MMYQENMQDKAHWKDVHSLGIYIMTAKGDSVRVLDVNVL